MEQGDPKRRKEMNSRASAQNSGALAASNAQGHLNQDVSALPIKTLLAQGIDVGRSKAGQQATQNNDAIGLGVGRLGIGLTNPMVLDDNFHGAIAPALSELEEIANSFDTELRASEDFWLKKLAAYFDPRQLGMLKNSGVSALKGLHERLAGPEDKQANVNLAPAGVSAQGGVTGQPGTKPMFPKRTLVPGTRAAYEAASWAEKTGLFKAKDRSSALGAAGELLPDWNYGPGSDKTVRTSRGKADLVQRIREALDSLTGAGPGPPEPAAAGPADGGPAGPGPAGRRLAEEPGLPEHRYNPDTPSDVNRGNNLIQQLLMRIDTDPYLHAGLQGAQMSDEQTRPRGTVQADDVFGQESRYEKELRAFLPSAGSDTFLDTRTEKQEKSLNLALWNNIIRDPQTGDANINPLTMGLKIQEGWRFSGNEKLLDPVFPGGSLNIGALPATTERLMLDPVCLEDFRAKFLSHRDTKRRNSAVNDYARVLSSAAANSMPEQRTDVQWVNNNKSNRDFQHSVDANNTMPIEPDKWSFRRQMDGELPLQANLLPAQGLFVSDQLGGGTLQSSSIFDPRARRDPTFNVPWRFGWNYGVPFQ
jgi:hypothetical protein